MDETRRHHPETDMGGIQPVMGNRRYGVIGGRDTLHVGAGTQRRLTRIAAIQKQAVRVRQGMAVAGGQLSEQVMGMLAVHQVRGAVCGFAAPQQ